MNEEIIYPHDKGIELKSKDDLFLNSVPFKNLVRYKSGKMSQFFRMTEWADGDENIIDVLNKIITLSSSGDT